MNYVTTTELVPTLSQHARCRNPW